MTNNNEHWNTVDWSQIPDDVEAVVLRDGVCINTYKRIAGVLHCKVSYSNEWFESAHEDFEELTQHLDGASLLVKRPPATPPLDKMEEPVLHQIRVDTFGSHMKRYEKVYGDAYIKLLTDTLHVTNKVDEQPVSYKVEYYEGDLPEGMINLDKVDESSVPSIQSILSDAQELIKKHHNITGEVKFTIKRQ